MAQKRTNLYSLRNGQNLSKARLRGETKDIPVDLIDVVEGFNPRSDIGDLKQLARSIRRFGIISALTVKPTDDGRFMLIAGHRRLAAAKSIGLKKVPCVLREDIDDIEANLLALAENSKDARSDVAPVDEGRRMYMLQQNGMDLRRICMLAGMSRQTVRKRIGLYLMAEKHKGLYSSLAEAAAAVQHKSIGARKKPPVAKCRSVSDLLKLTTKPKHVAIAMYMLRLIDDIDPMNEQVTGMLKHCVAFQQ